MELILTGVGEFGKLWCTRKSQGAGKGGGRGRTSLPLGPIPLFPSYRRIFVSIFRPYCHTLIVSPMSPNLKFSIKDLKFCKECMSIGLYQPVFSQFSVASISVCYLSHSSSDLNQRWRLQKILNAPLPHPPSRVNRKVCIKANLTPKVISYCQLKDRGRGGVEGGEGGGGALLYTYLFNCGY